MKKLLALLLLSSPCMAATITTSFSSLGTMTISSGTASAVTPAITRVAVNCSTRPVVGGANTSTITIPSTALGDLIVVTNETDVDVTANAYISTSTDNQGNTYKAYGTYGNFNPSQSNHGMSSSYEYAIDGHGGVTQVYPPNTNGISVCVMQYHSTQGWPANPVDVGSSHYSSSAGTWTSNNTATLSKTRELAIGVVGNKNGGSAPTWTNNSPWLNLFTSPVLTQVGENIVSATTAIAYSGTVSPNDDSSATIMTFKDNP